MSPRLLAWPLRRKAVADLWQRTGGALVILEPGTPAGFAAVSAARAQILADSTAGSSSSSGGGVPSAAHVVAPCPHDGPCPLEGRRSWCHFVQRFQRTGLQVGAWGDVLNGEVGEVG